MDPAKATEMALLSRQDAMNSVIDRFDSPVQQFYCGAVVLVTGGSGFLGKQLVEKLFRSCQIKKLFMLIRPKKGMTVQQRLKYILDDPVYDVIRKKQPDFASRIVGVEGDVADIRLGLSDTDWKTLADEVDIIFHMAATVRFDEPLRVATLINVRGTREVIYLARECKKLRCLNYVSTAFAHAKADRTEVFEQFYPCPVSPAAIIQLVETLDEERLIKITEELIKDWPNTYTFTKAIAEETVRTMAADLPVCIVKPPFVTSSYIEPQPGWVDNSCLSGPMGIVLGIGLGVIHVLYVSLHRMLSYAPVDYVNNATLAASWDSAERRRCGLRDIPIYTVSATNYGISWKFLGDVLRSDECVRLSTPKAVWYCCCLETENRFIYWILLWLLHYIPAYILDAILTVLGGMPKDLPFPSFVKAYTRIHNVSMVYSYFLLNEWKFRDDNLQKMIQRLSPNDKAIFNCDLSTIDYKEAVKAWCVGIRKFIIKDNLKDSKYAYKKQNILKYVNISFLIIYFYIIWKLFSYVCCTIAMVF